MKRLMLLLVTVSFFAFVPVSYAEECNYDKLREVASAIDVQTEIDYDSMDMGIFNHNIITVYGLTDDIYAMANDNSVGFFYDEVVNGSVSKSVDISDFDILEIYSISCPNERLKVINLSFEKYNIYADRAECEGLEDKVDVCSKTYDKDITSQEFLNKIEAYKNSLDDSQNNDSSNTFLNIIKEHVSLIIVGTILLVGLFIFLIIYKVKRNKLD